MSDWEDREGTSPECKTCGRIKVPVGRSIAMAAAGSGCTSETCQGYRDDPQPDHLFPGEKQSEFGYPKQEPPS